MTAILSSRPNATYQKLVANRSPKDLAATSLLFKTAGGRITYRSAERDYRRFQRPSVQLLAGASIIMPINARSQQNLKSRYKVSGKVRAVKQRVLCGGREGRKAEVAQNPAVARSLAASGGQRFIPDLTVGGPDNLLSGCRRHKRLL
jgi:hypothetical protein